MITELAMSREVINKVWNILENEKGNSRWREEASIVKSQKINTSIM